MRVLDLSRVLAGPVCSLVLGDIGGHVVKVERPGSGDETRGWGPPFDRTGMSAYFASVNRNKLSIALDLDDPDDRRFLLGLAAEADVVLDNFRRGTLERRGIDPRRILAEHGQLIWCTISGFGPDSDRPGYDFVVQAECGWMAITGEVDGEPMKTGVALADVIAGKDAAIAILSAMLNRGDPGRWAAVEQRRIEISLARSAVAALVNVAQNALVTGVDPRRWGNAHPNLVPYQLFQAADRPFVLAVGTDEQWLGACRAFDLAELALDQSLATNAGRVAQRGRVVTAITGRAVGKSASYWLGRLAREGVPCGVVRSVQDALAVFPASAETGVPPSVPGTVRLPPPRLDEHGEIIRAHGWGAFEHLEPETGD